MTEWRGTNQADNLKADSVWVPGNNGTNSTGFSARSGGARFKNGNFYFAPFYLGYWWSATEAAQMMLGFV